MARRNRGNLSLLGDRWEDIQVVGKLLLDREVDFSLKLIPLLALIYLISPIDLVPDVLLGPGQLDDIGLILLALSFFLRLAPSDRVARARRELGHEDEPVDVRVERDEDF